MMEAVRKAPAMSHQPPWFSGGIRRPQEGAGGSSPSQGNSRMNCTGSQFTEASMLRPMISKAMKPQTMDNRPQVPR